MLRGLNTTQVAVRLLDELLAQLDRRFPSLFSSRAEAVRAGIHAVLQTESLAERERGHRQACIDFPASPGSESTLIRDARSLLAEEPW